MPTILLSPIPVFENLMNRKNGFGLALKRMAKSAVDAKTFRKLMNGEASDGSARRVIGEMFAAYPDAKEIIEKFNSEMATEYSGETQSIERELAQGSLVWLPFIHAFASRVEQDQGPDARGELALVRHIVPLDHASIKVTASVKRGDISAACDLIERSAIRPFLTDEHLRAMRAANSPEAFVTASMPVRYIGLLFIAAALEHDLWPNGNESRLLNCLPIADEGSDSFPFARCLLRLGKLLDLKTYDDIVAALLIDSNLAHMDSQRKRYSRWRRGDLPEQPAFEEAMQRFFLKRGFPRQEQVEVEKLYIGLRYMHALSKALLASHFGSKKAFFDNYQHIYASMAK